MPNWKKLIVSGSNATLNALNVTTSITGSDVKIDDWGSISGSLATLTDNTPDGSGTANYITKWSDSDSLTDSSISDDGSTINLFANSTGNTGVLNIYGEGGVPPTLQVSSRTNRAKLKIADNDTAINIIAEGSIGSFGFGSTSSATNNLSILSSGNVGIGTSSPDRSLHVRDSAIVITKLEGTNQGSLLDLVNSNASQTYNGLRFTQGTTSKMAITHIADGTTKGYIQIGNNWATGSEILVVDGRTSNVGIGTTSPGVKLDVAGEIRTSSNYIADNATLGSLSLRISGTETGRLDNYNSALRLINFHATSETAISGNADISLKSVGSSNIKLSTANTERMRITSTGNVGIGTTNPTQLLHVYSGTSNPTGIGVQNNQRYYSVRSNNYSLVFTDETIGSERMRIDNNGNLGIGTTTPSAKLEVYSSGSTVFEVNGSQGQLFSITDSLSGSLFSVSDISGTPLFEVESDSTVTLGDYNTNTLVVTGSLVGIGKGDPDYKLHVKDNQDSSLQSGIVVERSANTQKAYFNVVGGAANIVADTNIPIKLRHGSTTRLEINTSGNSTFSGNLSTTGDLAAEDNIYLTDNGTVRAKLLLNASDRDNVELRAESLGSTMKFFTVGTEALLLDASQNATFAGSVHLDSDSGQLQFGDDNDMQIYHNGANGEINNPTGNFTIDSANAIILDFDSGGTQLMDGGIKFGTFSKNNDDFHITANRQDGDIKFFGNDNGSSVTALRLDMSDQGWAHFNTGIAVGNSAATSTFAGKVNIQGTPPVTANSNFNDLVITDSAHAGISIFSGNSSDGAIYFGDTDANNLGQIKYLHGSNTMTFATNDTAPTLTFDAGLNASFAGDVTVAGTITAQEFHTELVSASIVYESGSTKFGNTVDDNHDFTGSLNILAQSGADGITLNRSSTAYININNSSTRNEFNFKSTAGLRFYHGTDSSSPLFISSSGNVGIGTSSPLSRLTVAGGTGTTFNDGTLQVVGTIAMVSTSNLNAALNRWVLRPRAAGVDGTFDIYDARHSLTRLAINNSGQVKLPAYGSGTHTGTLAKSLGVDSSGNIIEFSGGSGGTVSTITSGADTRVAYFNGTDSLEGSANFTWDDSKLQINKSTIGEYLRVGSGGLRELRFSSYNTTSNHAGHKIDASSSNGEIAFATGGTARMHIGSTGNVGIGTTNPTFQLSIENHATTTSIATLEIDGKRTNGTAGPVGEMIFSNDGDTFATVAGFRDTADNKGSLQFQTQDSTFATRMTISSEGNVGIGNTDPSTKLYVDSGESTFNRGNSDGAIARFRGKNNEKAVIGTATSYFISNVGIGTTSPNSKLDVRQAGDGIALELHNTGGNVDDFVDIKMIAGNTTAGTLGTILRHQRDGSGGGDFSILTNPTLTGTPTEKLIVKSGGNVGIGITSPASTLHVLGPNGASGGITLSSSTSNNTQKVGRIKTSHYSNSEEPFTAILTNAQTSNNILRLGGGSGAENAATEILFYTATNNTTLTGSERMRITSAGNVGIGTTNPTAKLDVKGDGAEIYLKSADYSVARIIPRGTGANVDKGLFSLFDTGVENVRIDTEGFSWFNGGNVGIGTTSPDSKLSVTSTTLNSEDILYLKSGADNVNDYLGIAWELGVGGNGPHSAIRSFAGPSGSDVRLGFLTTSDGGTTLTEGLSVAHNGNVGIGTTSPGNKLHVSGGEIQVVNGSSGKLLLQNSTNYVYGDQNGVGIFNANDNLRLYTVGSERMRITSAGNVGIGTGVPSAVGGTAKLTINSNNAPVSIVNGTTDGMYIRRFDGANGHYQLQTTVGPGNSGTLSLQTYGGDVGIGTTSPSFNLHVNSASNGVTAIGVGNTGTGASRIYLDASNGDFAGSDYMWIGQNNDLSGEIFMPQSAGSFHIKTQPGGTATTQFTVNQAGNVGIGSSSPAYKLDVAGDIQNNGVFRKGGNVIIKSTGSETMIGPGGSGIITFHNSATMTAGDETVRIDASGNLMLNNTSAGARLDIREDTGYAIRAENASGHYFRVNTGGDTEIAGDLTVAGTITAQEFHTELVSASIVYESGSTKFGNSSDDNHDFTGSLNMLGSINSISSGVSSFERLSINSLQSWSAQDLGSASSGSVAFRINGRSGATNDFIVSSNGTTNYTMQVVGNATTSGQLHINPFGGNVGIGTTNAVQKLQVDGSIYSNGGEFFVNGDKGITAVGNLLFKAHNGTSYFEGMRLSSAGNVGIGTTNPDFKLQIATPGITSGSTYSWPFDLTRAGTSATRGFSIGVGTAGGNVALGNHNGDMSFGHTFGNDSNSHPQFYETMRIQHIDQAVGRVGIGTSSPSKALHISSGNADQLLLENSTSSGTARLQFKANSTRNAGPFIQCSQRGGSASDSDLQLGDETGTILTLNYGRAGIGTSSPKQLLHLSGGSTSGDVTKAVIGATGGNAESHLYLAENFSGENVNWGFSFVADGNSSNNLLIKRHSNNTSGTTVLTINRDNNNASFSGELQVASNLDINGTSLTLSSAAITYQNNNDVDTGTETIATVVKANYDAAFFDYVVKNGTNLRAGTVMAVHDGTNVEFTDNSTKDIGNTSGVTFSVDISGTDLRLRATTTSDNWVIKTLVKTL